MCMISIAGKGTDKYSEFFIESIKNGARLNNDYHGFAIKIAKTGALLLNKGFFHFEDLIKTVRSHNLKSDDELIIHSRTCSAGSITKANSHPFLLDPNMGRTLEAVMGPTTVQYPVMFHNGTFSEFRGTGTMSDTYNFVANFMRVPDIQDMFFNEPKKFEANFKSFLGTNRLAFLSKRYGIKTYGAFITDKGYQFSNGQYKVTAPFKGATPKETPEAKIIKLDKQLALGEALTMNIEINESNYDHFIYKAIANIPIDEIVLGETYYIKKLIVQNNQVMMQDTDAARYTWVNKDRLKNCFQLIPIGDNKQLYMNYADLHTKLHGTQSSVKKQYAALCTHLSRRAQRDIINVKFNKETMDVKVDSLLMWLRDYPQHVSIKNLESISRSLEKSEA